MADCGKCSKSFTKSNIKSKIDCNDCKASFHGKCVNMTSEDIQYYTEQEAIWRCEPCSRARRQSMTLESVTDKPMTYDDVYELISSLRNDIKEVESNLGTSLNHCHQEVKDTKDLVSKQGDEIANLVHLVGSLTAENIVLKNRIALLEGRMDDIEQYSRRDTIEIHGVPVERGEQVLEVVKKVGQALDVKIEDTMVSACHRLRGKQGHGSPPGIIVKMVRRFDAEAIVEKRRVKRNLSTHNIGMTSMPASPIYVNESLCQGRRRLLNAARDKKKEKLYTYLWIRGGKILMRKADGEPVKVITSLADLDKL